MRIALSLAALLMGSAAALAQDIVIRADIAQATVFLAGAEVTRRGTITIPPGTHRLLIAMPDAAQAERIGITGPDGLSLGLPQPFSGHIITEGALDDPAQVAARAAVTEAQKAFLQARDDMPMVDTGLRALEAQMSYLSALSQDGTAMPADPATLPEILAMLGAETERVQNGILAAQIARRDLTDALAARQADVIRAMAELERLRPLGPSIDGVAMTVTAETEITAEVTLDYFTHAAGWEPSYEFRLDSETGALDINRFITLRTSGSAVWQDVAATFSTAEPNRQRSPSEVYATPARILDPATITLGDSNRIGTPMPGLAMAEVEASPAMAAAPRATMQVNGLSVSYSYGAPVSVGPTGDAVLPFDTLTLATETEARGNPRIDATAFLMAMGQNDSGEAILPGYAAFFRDGALVGEDMIGLIPTGAKIDLAFGPLDHLRLVWIDRTLAEGDRGVFTSSTTQDRAIAFGVENTSDTAETVRVIYATPFGEQEDLKLDLTLAPAPDARNLDDRRGVHAWDLTVQPGQTALVEMGVSLAWPQGQLLLWQP